jgi:hypothetical protein
MVLKEIGEDYHYVGFVEMWNRHIEEMVEDRMKIEEMLSSRARKGEG